MYNNAIKNISAIFYVKEQFNSSVVLIHSVEVLILFKQLHVPNWRRRGGEKKKIIKMTLKDCKGENRERCKCQRLQH